MHPFRSIHRAFLALFLVFCTMAPTLAAAVVDFPYPNPLQATIVAALLKARSTVKSESIEISSRFPQRGVSGPLEGRGTVYVRYVEASKKAPLVFIVTGLAGTETAGEAAFLADRLKDAGYSSVVFPSPYFWRFALGISRTGYPGVASEDSADLYGLMVEVLKKLKREKRIAPTRYAYLGYSMGGFEGVFTAELDKKMGLIGMDRFVLVNPPVELLHGIGVLDSLWERGAKWSKNERDALRGRVIGAGGALLGRDISDPSYFLGLEKVFNQFTDDQTAFLIGDSMRAGIRDLAVVSQLAQDRRLLPGHPVKDWSSRLLASEKLSISAYVHKFVIPLWREKRAATGDAAAWEEALKPEISLREHVETLAGDSRIRVLHNVDDFLLQEGDVQFLAETLGDRFAVFTHGGHLGNLWFPPVLERLLSDLAE